MGVSTATLRAWERRYGVPSPARTASAYRLYSDADVQTIRKMRDLVQNGMAPAEASRQVLAESPAPASPAAADEQRDPYAIARDRIVEATVQFNPDTLQLEVGRALALGPSINIFERTIGPALQRIGDLWHDGTITIAQEHLASQVLLGTLSDLLRLAQPADASRRAALACFADEEHVLALYGVALRFASWGFRTVMIGARTPPPAIGRVVETLAPDAVALSATITPSPPRARELVDAYADACRSTVWMVGGQAAESMRPWIETRGGLVATATANEMRKQVDKAISERRRSKH
ncbi:MAG: MerR family transcriptional regulator [Minicystis sp.]